MDNFFMVHPDQMIRPSRYHELYRKRGLGVDSADKARKRFDKKDIIDLQCWTNLVWIHPLAFDSMPIWPSSAQRPRLDREGKAVADGKADGAASRSRSAAP